MTKGFKFYMGLGGSVGQKNGMCRLEFKAQKPKVGAKSEPLSAPSTLTDSATLPFLEKQKSNWKRPNFT